MGVSIRCQRRLSCRMILNTINMCSFPSQKYLHSCCASLRCHHWCIFTFSFLNEPNRFVLRRRSKRVISTPPLPLNPTASYLRPRVSGVSGVAAGGVGGVVGYCCSIPAFQKMPYCFSRQTDLKATKNAAKSKSLAFNLQNVFRFSDFFFFFK